jgi:hypothetical protein
LDGQALRKYPGGFYNVEFLGKDRWGRLVWNETFASILEQESTTVGDQTFSAAPIVDTVLAKFFNGTIANSVAQFGFRLRTDPKKANSPGLSMTTEPLWLLPGANLQQSTCRRVHVRITSRLFTAKEDKRLGNTILLSDAFPLTIPSSVISLGLSQPPADDEIVSATCSFSENLAARATVVGPPVQSMSARIYLSGTSVLSFPVTAPFVGRPLESRPLIAGSMLCDVRSTTFETEASLPQLPVYQTERLSIRVIYLPARWPLFSDVLVESSVPGLIRSVWDPPGAWSLISAIDGSFRALSYSENIIARTLGLRKPFGELSDVERMSVIESATKLPKRNHTVFALSIVPGANITLVADRGIWMAPAKNSDNFGTDDNVIQASGAAFTKDTQIFIGDIRCRISWVALDGRAVRFEVPPLESICSPSSASSGCFSLVLKVESGSESSSIREETMIDLIANSPTSLYSESQIIGSGARLETTISCPPFCPHSTAEVFTPVSIGSNVSVRTVVPGPRVSFVAAPSDLIASVSEALLKPAYGISVSLNCELDGFESPLSARCAAGDTNALCAYTAAGKCLQCPEGAVCPGGPLILPRAGYWSPGWPYNVQVIRCAEPALRRCPAINATTLQFSCGAGYRQDTIACSACADGYFPSFVAEDGSTSCLPCNFPTIKRIVPTVLFVMSLVIVGIFVFAVCLFVNRFYGSSKAVSARRAVKLIFVFYMAVQYLVQVGKTTRELADLPSFMRRLLAGLDALQFAGLSIPSECQRLPPFTLERVVFGMMLFFLVGLIVSVVILPYFKGFHCVSTRDLLTRVKTVARASIRNAPTGETIVKETDTLYGSVLIRGLLICVSIIYTVTVNTCFQVIRCDTGKPMRVQQYLTLENDGSTLDRYPPPGFNGSPLYNEHIIPVSVVTKYPYYVCGESDHGKIRPLAIAVLVLCALFPVVSVILVTYRLRTLFVQQYRRYPSGFVLSVPFHLVPEFVRSFKTRLFVGRLTPNGTMPIISGMSIEPKAPSTTTVDNLIEIRQDPYLQYFMDGEYRPSAFYFSSLLLSVNFLLSLSFNVLSNNARARFALTFSVLLLMALAIVCTRPFRQMELFSSVAQTSLLGIAMFVSLTDVVGHTSGGRGILLALAYLDIIIIFLIPCILLLLFFKAIVDDAKHASMKEKEHSVSVNTHNILSSALRASRTIPGAPLISTVQNRGPLAEECEFFSSNPVDKDSMPSIEIENPGQTVDRCSPADAEPARPRVLTFADPGVEEVSSVSSGFESPALATAYSMGPSRKNLIQPARTGLAPLQARQSKDLRL